MRYQLEFLELLQDLSRQQNLSIITVLHDISLAICYSDHVAMLCQGELVAIGTPDQVINPENLRQKFGVEAVTINAPIGLQICLLPPPARYTRSRDAPQHQLS